jgi:ABC-2 type transport system permease protein
LGSIRSAEKEGRRIKVKIEKLFGLLKIGFLEGFAYRLDLVMALLSSLILIGIYYFLWGAVFKLRPLIDDMDFSFMVSYICLVQIIQRFSQTEHLERDIAEQVRDGSIATQLMRPWSFQVYSYLTVYARSLFSFVMTSIPLFLFSFFLLGLKFPGFLNLLLFILSLQLAFLVSAGLSFLVGLAAFYLRSNEGVIQVKDFIATILSGALVPLAMFPNWLERLSSLLPFQTIVAVPIGIYTGTMSVEALLLQLFWAAALLILGKSLFLAARRKLEILGG